MDQIDRPTFPRLLGGGAPATAGASSMPAAESTRPATQALAFPGEDIAQRRGWSGASPPPLGVTQPSPVARLTPAGKPPAPGAAKAPADAGKPMPALPRRGIPPPIPMGAMDRPSPLESFAALLSETYRLHERASELLRVNSKDYRIVLALEDADLDGCDPLIDQLRQRVEGDVRFQVVEKLREACALALRIPREGTGEPPK